MTLLYAYQGAPFANGADKNEDVLLSYTVPANTLGPGAGTVLHVMAAGTCASSTDVKYMRVDMNGLDSLIADTIQDINDTMWKLDTWVVYTGQNSFIRVGDGRGFINVADHVTAKEPQNLVVDWTQPVVLTVTGQNMTNAVAGSVTALTLVVSVE